MHPETIEKVPEATDKAVATEHAQGDPEQLGDAGKRALKAERDARSAAERELVETRQKLAEFERANETEQQRLQRERDEATSGRTTAELVVQRYEAAEKAGIPLSWARRLVGSTADELLADAKTVAADLGSVVRPGTPKPDPSQGSSGTSGGSATVAAGRQLFADMHKKDTNTN